jgi:AcrR family transcriptional regulator
MSERKEQILVAARDLFLERGPAGTTMRKVAARVGISATAIYRHYRDRDALIGAVTAEGYQVFSSYLFRALSEPGPRERLVAAGRHYLRFAVEHDAYYRLIFLSWDRLPARGPGRRGDADGPAFRFLQDRVTECQRAGIVPADRPPMQVALYLWAVCHGLATMYVAGGLRALGAAGFLGLAEPLAAGTIDDLAAAARGARGGKGSSRR